MENENQKDDTECRVTTFQVMISVLASILGVQKSEALKRDFQYGKPGQFIIVSLIMTLTFIFFVYGLVQLAFWYFNI